MDFYNDQVHTITDSNYIPQEKFQQAGIARGLRKANGNGILVGITTISDALGKENNQNCQGKILYRGIDLDEIVEAAKKKPECAYEETAYLLLFGMLPTQEQLQGFKEERSRLHRELMLPLEKIISREDGHNIMNIMGRCILSLYDYDTSADSVTLPNAMKQAMELISLMSVISVNIYNRKYCKNKEEYKLISDEHLPVAENILYMLRGKGNYTELEVKILDLCMVLHAELGGGNNSAFTTQVVASSGTDTYAVIASAIGSIKGPKHGGANIKTFQMFQNMKQKLHNWTDEEEIETHLAEIVHKNEFDKTGLIYGVGHAVFTLSDPRTKVLKELAHKLSECKHRDAEFALYEKVEKIAPKVIQKEKKLTKPICANVDFYSGFVYDLLGIPLELFTPMFVNARIAGWSAHRIEEMCNESRIVHPAYQCVTKESAYKQMKTR